MESTCGPSLRRRPAPSPGTYHRSSAELFVLEGPSPDHPRQGAAHEIRLSRTAYLLAVEVVIQTAAIAFAVFGLTKWVGEAHPLCEGVTEPHPVGGDGGNAPEQQVAGSAR